MASIATASDLLTRSRTPLKKAVRKCAPTYYNRVMEAAVENRVHWISPSSIQFATLERSAIDRFMPSVAAGDWDQNPPRFDETDFFQACKHVLVDKGQWHSTAWYSTVLSRIRRGETLWNCRSEGDFIQRLSRIEEIYQNMSRWGYLPSNNKEEISVNVSRDGDLLLNDGQHRLAIAKLLGIKTIPVRIVARHLDWVEFKNQILEFARSHNGEVYAPLMHPDLEWIPSAYGHQRFEMIRRALTTSSGRVLDIGCNWGYFCHQLQSLGFKCLGVELDPWVFHFTTKLRRSYRGEYDLINSSVFDAIPDSSDSQFDVVLALAIFHHFVKTREGLEQLISLLNRLKPREMFFIPHQVGETQMAGAYWNPTEDDFVKFILEHCATLRHASLLGHIEDGRKLYHLVS